MDIQLQLMNLTTHRYTHTLNKADALMYIKIEDRLIGIDKDYFLVDK